MGESPQYIRDMFMLLTILETLDKTNTETGFYYSRNSKKLLGYSTRTKAIVSYDNDEFYGIMRACFGTDVGYPFGDINSVPNIVEAFSACCHVDVLKIQSRYIVDHPFIKTITAEEAYNRTKEINYPVLEPLFIAKNNEDGGLILDSIVIETDENNYDRIIYEMQILEHDPLFVAWALDDIFVRSTLEKLTGKAVE